MTIYMFSTMLFTTINRYIHPSYQCVTRRARMVAGRMRWSATSDQARRWHTQWKQQQSGEDAEEEHEKINVSPIPTARNPPQGEAVHYTGGSLRGETSRDVMDTHLPSNSNHNGKSSNRNGNQNISHIPPNNDHNGRSNSRNGNKGSRDGCEVRHDIRCIIPNMGSAKMGSAKHTWNWAFIYI